MKKLSRCLLIVGLVLAYEANGASSRQAKAYKAKLAQLEERKKALQKSGVKSLATQPVSKGASAASAQQSAPLMKKCAEHANCSQFYPDDRDAYNLCCQSNANLRSLALRKEAIRSLGGRGLTSETASSSAAVETYRDAQQEEYIVPKCAEHASCSYLYPDDRDGYRQCCQEAAEEKALTTRGKAMRGVRR